jgi:hypothetical protein
MIMERKAGQIPTPLKRNYTSKKCFDIKLSYDKNEGNKGNKGKGSKILINNILNKRCILPFEYTTADRTKITTNLLKLIRKKILRIHLDNSLKSRGKISGIIFLLFRGNESVFKSNTILYLTVLFKRSLSPKIRPV